MEVATKRHRDAINVRRHDTERLVSMLNQFTTSPQFGDPRLPPHFWSKVRQELSGCWLWQGAQSPYGQFSIGGRLELAHRHAYQVLVGPIPEGLEIDHLCRTPPCVNPLHMEAVTRSVNILRGRAAEGLRALQRAKTHCPHGHPYSGENLYINPKGARMCRRCGRDAWHRRKPSVQL